MTFRSFSYMNVRESVLCVVVMFEMFGVVTTPSDQALLMGQQRQFWSALTGMAVPGNFPTLQFFFI